MVNYYAIWIEDLLGEIKKNPTEENIKLIEACGKSCAYHKDRVRIMEELHKETTTCETTSDYANFLKERLMLNVKEVDDGIELHLGNEECPCELSSEIKNNSDALCYCTIGQNKLLWSTLFGKPVDIEIVESILRGGNDCVLKIIL